MICDDFSLYYEVNGTHGPYILMLHGVLSSRVQWQANINALSVFGRPVVVELFGHGRSPTPDKAEFYKPEAYCLEFERIRKEIGTDKWFVVGNSLGGATAQALIDIQWQGLKSKQDFVQRQQDEPFILSMGLEAQRKLVTKNGPSGPQ